MKALALHPISRRIASEWQDFCQQLRVDKQWRFEFSIYATAGLLFFMLIALTFRTPPTKRVYPVVQATEFQSHHAGLTASKALLMLKMPRNNLDHMSIIEQIGQTQESYGFRQMLPTFGKLDLSCLQECTKEELKELIMASAPPRFAYRMKEILGPTLELAAYYHVDPFWVLAVMWTESSFDHSSVSSVGAIGFMQIMPATGRFLAKRMRMEGASPLVGPFKGHRRIYRHLYKDPLVNIEMGIYYLKFLKEFFKGNVDLATIAYNSGPYAVKWRLRRGRSPKVNDYLEKVQSAYQELTQYLVAI